MIPKPQIIYEDGNFFVLNKPPKLITHPRDKDDKQPSIKEWVAKNHPKLKNIGESFIASGHPLPRYGIVHRLDKDASGLLIIAKNNKSFFYFKNLFQTRKIKKYYLALIHGQPKQPKSTIRSPLGRIGLKRTTRIIGKKLIDKKEAETEYETLKKYKDFSLLELRPKTGRTHQLRVHLNSIGHPIAGDTIYGFEKLPPLPGLDRLFLHAYKLEFTAPDSKALVLEADLPESLSSLLENLE